MLCILFKLQSNHSPLVDSTVTMQTDTAPVRMPLPDERKSVTLYRHVSSNEL